MNHKDRIHFLLHECANEVLAFVRERESLHAGRWVPAVEVKESLQLNFVPYPKSSEQHGEKGWLFAILARMLEDRGALEYKRDGSRSFCRSTRP
ncbi:hypothetical protein [Ideonella sp. YS5]|uniref:hypothetical protein n=1 Tax=Ideonella sp. YS5 TaxID=3453714 RepID=UPI003EE8328E